MFSPFRKINKIIATQLNHNVKQILQQRTLYNKQIKEILQTDLDKANGVTVQGWVKRFSEGREVDFLHITDGSTNTPLQVIINKQTVTKPASFGAYDSCVEVYGTLVESPAKGQRVEMQAQQIRVIADCDQEDYPLQRNHDYSMDHLRQLLHLRNRHHAFGALLRVRNQATQAMHHYYQNAGFIQIHTPILSSNDCEGAGETFTVQPSNKSVLSEITDDKDKSTSLLNEGQEFFDIPTFLTVSAQLHLEVMASSMSRVYTFSPTFRAENSRTRHHLSEFYMVEAEISFTDKLEDICEDIESLLKSTTKSVLENCQDDVSYFIENVAPAGHMVNLEKLTEKPFVRLEYSDAIRLLEKYSKEFKEKPSWGINLQKEHEKWLVEYCDNYPVFVLNFPTEIKPFYARINDDSNTAATVDLLAPAVGEICGGSLREERYDILKSRQQQLGLSNALQWYLDLRRYGSPAHGGYGVGFERYIQTLLGIHNIRDTIPFPRYTHHCKL